MGVKKKKKASQRMEGDIFWKGNQVVEVMLGKKGHSVKRGRWGTIQ